MASGAVQMPTTPTRPSTSATCRPASITPGRPVHSSTTGGAVPSASTAASASSDGSTARSAPRLRARSRRAGWGSDTSTSAAPRALAQSTAASPMGPPPRTATRSPGCRSTRRRARRAMARGSTRAWSSPVTAAGRANSSSAPRATSSAKPPGRLSPTRANSVQWSGRPARQCRHAPQPKKGRATTWVPGVHRSSSPASRTTPAISWPSTVPGSPMTPATCRSLPQMPHAVTSTTTSPGAGRGSSTSASSRWGRSSVRTAARTGR